MSLCVPHGCVGASNVLLQFVQLRICYITHTNVLCQSKAQFQFPDVFACRLLLLHISYHILSYLLNNMSPYALQHVSGIDCCYVDVHNCIGVHNYKMITRIAKSEKGEKITPLIWLRAIHLFIHILLVTLIKSLE